MQYEPEHAFGWPLEFISATNISCGKLTSPASRLGRAVFTLLPALACSAAPVLAQPLQSQPLNWSQATSLSTNPSWATSQSSTPQQQPSWRTVLPNSEPTTAGVTEQPSDPAPQQVAATPTPQVMAMSRGITVNRTFYPDVSITVPNGFKRDPQRFLSLSFDATNQIRSQAFTGCRGDSSCADVEFNAELALLQSGPVSLELLYTVANTFPDSNNSSVFTGQQLGFRLAANLSPTFGVAIGGESQLDLDGKYAPVVSNGAQQLKGRTLYAVASVAFPMSKAPTPPVLTLSAGAGNGYYGLSSSGVSDSQWGPFGSVSYAFNDRVSLGVEYSGYALSAGFSVRPFKDIPLTTSFYVTDFVGGVPDAIDSFCFEGSCSTRFLGRITYSL